MLFLVIHNIKLEFNFELNLYNNIIERKAGFISDLIFVTLKYRGFGMDNYFIAGINIILI